MKYYEVSITWSSGFEHSYCIAGSNNSKQHEEERLNKFNHVTTYNIKEIDEYKYQELKQGH